TLQCGRDGRTLSRHVPKPRRGRAGKPEERGFRRPGVTRRRSPAGAPANTGRITAVRLVMFYHSLVSDWNHGNAHFLRGIVSELLARGHDVHVLEPVDGWSARNLRTEFGLAPLERFRQAYPGLQSRTYDPGSLDLDAPLDGA